jgi:hypothetical protein
MSVDIASGTEKVGRYLATGIDIERASSRVLALVGPLADISEKYMAAVLAEAAECVPTARLALDPRPASRSWSYRRRDWREVIVRRHDLDTADLGQLLTDIGNRPGDRLPLEVVICGDYLIVDYSHALGDGKLGAMLLALLGNDGALRPESLAPSIPRHAPWKALIRHFAMHPSRARDVMRLRKTNQQALAKVGDLRAENWESARRGMTAYMEPATVAEFRSWSAPRFPDSSSASLTVALLAESLRTHGVVVDEHVTILVDCRRYFEPQYQAGHGNFAVGIPILVPAGSSPTDVRRQMREAIESGRPLARLGVAELKARLGRPEVPAPAEQADVPDRVRLTVSDLGRLTVVENLHWKAKAQPPRVAAYVETDGPDAVDVEVTELLGGRTFTASYCSEMLASSTIEAAFKRMCDDPFAVLRSLE